LGRLRFRLGFFYGRRTDFSHRSSRRILALLRLALLTEIFAVAARFAWLTLLAVTIIALLALRRRRRLLLAARRLDAAQGTAQFFQLPFIHDFLPFGHFDEFKHFVELINHVLERNRNFCGMLDGLCNCGTFCGTKISGLYPRFWRGRALKLLALRSLFLTFGAALLRTLNGAAFARLRSEWWWLGNRPNLGLAFGSVAVGVMRRKIIRFLCVWFAKTTCRVRLVLPSLFGRGRLLGGFRRVGIFFGFGRGIFICGGAGATTTATTTTATTAAIRRTKGRGSWT
jgi:hypothetical protein